MTQTFLIVRVRVTVVSASIYARKTAVQPFDRSTTYRNRGVNGSYERRVWTRLNADHTFLKMINPAGHNWDTYVTYDMSQVIVYRCSCLSRTFSQNLRNL